MGDRGGGAGGDDWGRLESTYLKAKNGADQVGDRKAAAEFFIHEMHSRRRRNTSRARDGDTRAAKRLTAAGSAVGNYLLHQSCGYGERLWRVVYVSALSILGWTLLYATLTRGTEGTAQGLTTKGVDSLAQLATPEGVDVLSKNLYFSVVTFTTLGYGDIQPVGTVARFLAGLESFVGALMIALVVFVLGRRVSW